MKKLMMMAAMVMVMSLVLAACSTTIDDETTPAGTTEEKAAMEDEKAMDDDMADEEVMDKEDDMKKDEAMDKEDDMDKEETMDKEDAMDKEDDMKHDDTMDKEDEMKKDDDMDKEDDMDETSMMKNEGDMAPDFSLMSQSGDIVSLADLKGEKVYVKFWASWCSICVAGLPELDELAGGDEDFTVVTIVSPGSSGEKSAEDFKEWFAGKNTENITVLFDEGGEIRRAYGVRGVPTSAYIGSDGVLIKTAPGHQSNAAIRESFGMFY